MQRYYSVNMRYLFVLNFQGIELNEAMQWLLKSKIIIILFVMDIITYALFFGGIIAFLGFSFWYLVRRNQENKIVPIT